MNSRIISKLLIFTIVLEILIGCTVQPGSTPKYEETNSTEVDTNTEANIPIPTQTKIRNKTKTKVIGGTYTPTIIDLSTSPSHQTTLTPTISVTNTDDEREEFIQPFLDMNDSCRMPCFWEIMPGKTPWLEISNRINKAGINIYSTEIENKRTLYSIPLDVIKNHMFSKAMLVEQDGVVSQILIRSEGFGDPVYFQTIWHEYSPEKITFMYGIPIRVWLQTYANTMGDRHAYTLWLVYDDDGFMIQYEGFLEEKETTFRICPRFVDGTDIMFIRLFIKDLDDKSLLEDVGGLIDLSVFSRAKSIEIATGLTVDDIYDVFQQNPDMACFETPRNIWESGY